MRRSAGKGDRRGTHRGRRRLRPRHLPGTDAFHRCDGAPKARAKLLPGPKAARLQPTPSPDRSPDPARQPALAPGLSLVPHGCGDPLIRLVQAPQLNRVLEGWKHQLDAVEAAPCVREAGGQGRLSCRVRGPTRRRSGLERADLETGEEFGSRLWRSIASVEGMGADAMTGTEARLP